VLNLEIKALALQRIPYFIAKYILFYWGFCPNLPFICAQYIPTLTIFVSAL